MGIVATITTILVGFILAITYDTNRDVGSVVARQDAQDKINVVQTQKDRDQDQQIVQLRDYVFTKPEPTRFKEYENQKDN